MNMAFPSCTRIHLHFQHIYLINVLSIPFQQTGHTDGCDLKQTECTYEQFGCGFVVSV